MDDYFVENASFLFINSEQAENQRLKNFTL